MSIEASHSYNIDPETIADVSLKIEGAASPKQMVLLVVFINPGETKFSLIKIVAEAEQLSIVSAITTTSAPSVINIGGVKFDGSKILVELLW